MKWRGTCATRMTTGSRAEQAKTTAISTEKPWQDEHSLSCQGFLFHSLTIPRDRPRRARIRYRLTRGVTAGTDDCRPARDRDRRHFPELGGENDWSPKSAGHGSAREPRWSPDSGRGSSALRQYVATADACRPRSGEGACSVAKLTGCVAGLRYTMFAQVRQCFQGCL